MKENSDVSRTDQAPSAWQTYGRLTRYVKPYWYGWAIAFIGFVIAAISQLAWAELLEWLLESVDNKFYDRRWYIAGAILLIFFVRGISTFVGQYSMTYVSVQVVGALRRELFNKLLHLPYSFHQKQSAGRILTLVTYNTEQLSGATTDAVRTLLQDGLLAIALLGYLLYVNWQLSLLFVLMTPVIGWLVSFAAKRLKQISGRIQTTMGDVAQVTGDTVKGYQIVKSFQGESLEANRFEVANSQSIRQNLKLAVTSGLATPIIQFIVGMQMAILVALALQPSFLNEVGAPQFMAYITAAGLLVKPAKSLSGINATLMRGVAAAEQIFAILDLKVESLRGKYLNKENTGELDQASGSVKTSELEVTPLRDGSVVFDQVTFKYSPELPAVFSGLNLTVNSGEMVALVGKTGSGKTTITDLLMGFFDIDSGDIRVGQCSISEFDLSHLRAHIALVPQFSEVFQGTIRDNIAYGSLAGASDEAVLKAASMAHALEFIEKLPEGFNTQLGEHGVKLSGGQRQRLAIARAILKNAPILVMDEATSALDNESERFIQQAMDGLRGQMTIIVIAHRLSTVEQADRIFVIDEGQVAESGSHQELIDFKGAYSHLYTNQLDES